MCFSIDNGKDGHTEGQEEAYQEQGICLRLVRGPRGRIERYGGAPGAQVRPHDPQVGVGEAKGAKNVNEYDLWRGQAL